MRFVKKGLVYQPDKQTWWKQRYAIMPTPILSPDKKFIRVYFGITDNERNGRVTFIDVDSNDPRNVISNPDTVVLDIGTEGTFDDSGVVPSSIINENGQLKLYYVGFQRSEKVPYLLFSGLAISNSFNEKFIRRSFAPIIDRSANSPFSNAAPFVMKTDKSYKMWFWEGNEWLKVNGKKYINAVISYAESSDGETWRVVKRGCIVPNKSIEFSVGRPWVFEENGSYKMIFSVRNIDKLYRIGYAESINGIDWIRREIDFDVSSTGWDSEMVCYPSLIKFEDKTYLFYNGNNNGETGFGLAEWVND